MTSNDSLENAQWVEFGELIDNARNLYDLKDYAQAIPVYQKALHTQILNYPERAVVLSELGFSLYYVEDYQAAAKTLSLVLELNEQFDNKAPVYRMLGTSYFKLENYEKSIEYRKLAYEIIDEKHIKIEIRLELGFSYHHHGDYKKAKKCFQDYLRQCQDASHSESAIYHLGFAKYFLKDYKGAVKDFQYLIDNAKSVEYRVKGYYGLARYYYLADRFELLEIVVNKILDLDDQFSERETVLFYRIMVHAAKENMDTTGSFLKDFISEFPKSKFLEQCKDFL